MVGHHSALQQKILLSQLNALIGHYSRYSLPSPRLIGINYVRSCLITTKFITVYECFLVLSATRLTYVSYSKPYHLSIPQNVVNLIQIKRFYLDFARKTKHLYVILQLKLYSHYIRKVLFIHMRQMRNDYCAGFYNCNVKEFWRRSTCHFSSVTPSVEGILRNGIPGYITTRNV